MHTNNILDTIPLLRKLITSVYDLNGCSIEILIVISADKQCLGQILTDLTSIKAFLKICRNDTEKLSNVSNFRERVLSLLKNDELMELSIEYPMLQLIKTQKLNVALTSSYIPKLDFVSEPIFENSILYQYPYPTLLTGMSNYAPGFFENDFSREPVSETSMPKISAGEFERSNEAKAICFDGSTKYKVSAEINLIEKIMLELKSQEIDMVLMKFPEAMAIINSIDFFTYLIKSSNVQYSTILHKIFHTNSFILRLSLNQLIDISINTCKVELIDLYVSSGRIAKSCQPFDDLLLLCNKKLNYPIEHLLEDKTIRDACLKNSKDIITLLKARDYPFLIKFEDVHNKITTYEALLEVMPYLSFHDVEILQNKIYLVQDEQGMLQLINNCKTECDKNQLIILAIMHEKISYQNFYHYCQKSRFFIENKSFDVFNDIFYANDKYLFLLCDSINESLTIFNLKRNSQWFYKQTVLKIFGSESKLNELFLTNSPFIPLIFKLFPHLTLSLCDSISKLKWLLKSSCNISQEDIEMTGLIKDVKDDELAQSIAIFSFERWLDLNKMKKFEILEIGGGDGKLCDDIIKYCSKKSVFNKDWMQFLKSFNYVILDKSRALLQRQKVINENNKNVEIYYGDALNLTESEYYKSRRRANLIISNELMDMFPPHKIKLNNDFNVVEEWIIPSINEEHISQFGLSIEECQKIIKIAKLNKKLLIDTHVVNIIGLPLTIHQFKKLQILYSQSSDRKEIFHFQTLDLNIHYSPKVLAFLQKHPLILANMKPGDFKLIQPSLSDYVAGIKSICSEQSSFIITIDYGDSNLKILNRIPRTFGEIKNNNDIFDLPGYFDITCDVNFSNLASEIFSQNKSITVIPQNLIAKIKECDLVWMSSDPTKETLGNLPIRSCSAYVRSENKLFYINNTIGECKEIVLSEEKLAEFDDATKPSKVAKSLSAEELKQIISITGPTQMDHDGNKADFERLSTSLFRSRNSFFAAIIHTKNSLPLPYGNHDRKKMTESEIVKSKKNKLEQVLKDANPSYKLGSTRASRQLV